MKETKKIEKLTIQDILKYSSIFVLLGLMLLYIHFDTLHSENTMFKYGVDTECVIVAYQSGSIGVREKINGYRNQCQYFIGDSIHYCYVFTSIKPLPLYTKLKMRYLQKKNRKIVIDFPDEYKEEYKEYGFNDYGGVYQ